MSASITLTLIVALVFCVSAFWADAEGDKMANALIASLLIFAVLFCRLLEIAI